MIAVAENILHQLGDSRFILMTGAKQFVKSEDGLTFRIPLSNGINLVNVTLDEDDTYRVTFFRWNQRRLEKTIVATHSTVYCDMLRSVFENETGLFTTL